MAYFDLVAMQESAVNGLEKRLGFKRIFCLGSNAELMDNANMQQDGRKKIIKGGSPETLARGLKRNDVVAAMIGERSLSGKELETLKEIGKPLLIPIARIACASESERKNEMRRAKVTVREAMLHRAPIALASLAERQECLMSAQQMLGIGGLLGLEGAAAQRALAVLGDVL